MLSLELTYRRIDPDEDALLAYAHHRAACVASFGTIERAGSLANYAHGLKARVEEFPEGNVIAMASGQCVGQLDLQAPYGLPTGYINLYYVRAPFRRQGFGRSMHAYVERYFRNWEVNTIELHVSRDNLAARGFYHALGYRIVRREGDMLRMALPLIPSSSPSAPGRDPHDL